MFTDPTVHGRPQGQAGTDVGSAGHHHQGLVQYQHAGRDLHPADETDQREQTRVSSCERKPRAVKQAGQDAQIKDLLSLL